MNLLLTIGSILVIGYAAGWVLEKIALPKIIGYIATGVMFSPNTNDLVDPQIIQSTSPLMEVSLAFIAFEVGGALRWSKIREHEKEIISITLLASLFPLIFITLGVCGFGWLFPGYLPFDLSTWLLLSLLLGALASPTEPATTLAVMHQYKAMGKVSDTILGVTALDDVLGILLFSLIVAIIYLFTGAETGLFGNPVLNSFYEIVVALMVGAVLGFLIDPISRFFQIASEGQWVIILFSLIIFCVGVSKALKADFILSAMTMGMVVINKCQQRKLIFRILERYTEDLIFLFFFLLSGLHLNISTIPQVTFMIVLFVLLRAAGKYVGASMGARMVSADPSIQKYTAGGLLPQGGIVIGLVLSIYLKEQFSDISEMLLTIIMGTVVIHELIGPIAAKYSLKKAGEITDDTKQQSARGNNSPPNNTI